MIVVGVDVHKHSLTAVAVDELGRTLAERGGPVDAESCRVGALAGWRAAVGARGLPACHARARAGAACRGRAAGAGAAAVDCAAAPARPHARQVGPDRRARGRPRSAAGAAISDGPRAGEEPLRELKLLVDHRDDLVDERRRAQQRLRWHLHELDPTLTVPLGALDRTVWLDRLGRQLARQEQTRPGADRPRARRPLPHADPHRSSRSTASCKRGRQTLAPRLLAAARLRPVERRQAALRDRPDRPLPTPTRSSPATPASHRSTPAPANTNATASTAAATANSTAPCTGSRSRKAACTHPHAPTSSANRAKARADAKRSAASNDNSPAPSTPRSKTSQH